MRYKGYYYDQETNLYYCKSRYYSPEIYRWLSRDDVEYLDPSSITRCNFYVYCNSNPVMYYFNTFEGSTINIDKEYNSIKTFNLYLENDATNIFLEFLILEHNIGDNNFEVNILENLQLKENDKIKEQNNDKNNEFLVNVSISFIGGGDPETFAKAADSVIKGFFCGNGGGINSNRLNDLVDVILEICEW